MVNDLPERLAELVGPAHVVRGEAAADFTHDATFLEHGLLAVVRPGGTLEVAAGVFPPTRPTTQQDTCRT